jgi:hypothetical protein
MRSGTYGADDGGAEGTVVVGPDGSDVEVDGGVEPVVEVVVDGGATGAEMAGGVVVGDGKVVVVDPDAGTVVVGAAVDVGLSGEVHPAGGVADPD